MEQNVYKVITDKRSLPFNETGTGTVVTSGVSIVGTGTLFKTEMPAGSYLVDLTNDEVRRVERVDSDTEAYLEKPFTSNLASAAPEIIAAWKAKVKEISISTGDTCELNGESFTGTLTISRYGNDRSSRRDLVEPVIVDATSGSMQVNIINY